MPDPSPTTLVLTVGKTYRGKRRRPVGLDRWDDRVVLWISSDGKRVQYDSASVGLGRHYPTVTVERFLAWAKEEVPDAR